MESKDVSDVTSHTVNSDNTENVYVEAAGRGLAANGNLMDDGLQRGLKRRHLQMIAFGGVVGASIWYGTGYAISYAGPVGALICFFVTGLDVFFVMQSLGEMSTLFPISGAFMEMAGRFVDPALAFAVSWNYWYMWITYLAGDYNAFSLIMGLWTEKVPSYGWILIAWVFYQTTSLLGVVVYGEMEFWLASWKLLCLIGGFLVAILINTGAIGGDYIGFRYWAHPGPFVNGINGFGQTFLLAAEYYCGTEMIGESANQALIALTAGESRNPKKDVPAAIKQTFWRILIIFCGLVFFASIIVPSDSDQLLSATSKSGKSPWTIALVQAGWPGAGSLVNVVMITAQFSSINSAIYVAARSLYNLAISGRAPKFFAKTTSNGVPLRATIFSNLLGLAALMNIATGPDAVFGYLVDLGGSATFIAWLFIGVTHIRMRKAWVVQGHSLDELPFRALWYPYGAYFVIVINIFLIIICGYTAFLGHFQVLDFVFTYLTPVLFIILFVSWKFLKKTKMVKLEEMDLVTGRKMDWENVEEDDDDEPKGTFKWIVKAKRFVFS